MFLVLQLFRHQEGYLQQLWVRLVVLVRLVVPARRLRTWKTLRLPQKLASKTQVPLQMSRQQLEVVLALQHERWPHWLLVHVVVPAILVPMPPSLKTTPLLFWQWVSPQQLRRPVSQPLVMSELQLQSRSHQQRRVRQPVVMTLLASAANRQQKLRFLQQPNSCQSVQSAGVPPQPRAVGLWKQQPQERWPLPLSARLVSMAMLELSQVLQEKRWLTRPAFPHESSPGMNHA